jgi:preprotein translocase subunit SecG
MFWINEKRKSIRWKKNRPILQRVFGKFHAASVAGFLISLTVGMAIILLITGLALFYVTWQNEKFNSIKTEIQHP